MSVDLSKIVNRLNSFQKKNDKANYFWKPVPGTQIVRLLPYQYNKENPFVELQFYYNLGGKTYISPASFGKPDPILEFCDKLKRTGIKEEWLMARKMEPKMRTYVPVLVRNQEQEGVKFWGFGKNVYQEILKIMADPDYGDITDLVKGHDIVVEFKSAVPGGKQYPETTIRAKPQKTPAVDPQRKDLIEKISKQVDLTTLFVVPEYDDLKKSMDAWLNPTDTEDPTLVNDEGNSEPSSQEATELPKSGESVDDYTKSFDELFNK